MSKRAFELLFPDEYSGDRGRTDYRALAQATSLCAIKCGEGIGSYSSYPPMAAGARRAGLTVLAYFWPLMREDGAAQAHQHHENAGPAEAIACDLERGNLGGHSYNGDASKTTILRVMHAYFDELHRLRPQPLLLYGASFMGDVRISWRELVGARDWIWAWLPRYDGGGDIKGWSRAQILRYSSPERYGVPASRIAAVQFTNGIQGPQPHTMAGLGRSEDISALLVPLSQITTEEEELTKEQAQQLQNVESFMKGFVKQAGLDPTKRGSYEKAGRALAKSRPAR